MNFHVITIFPESLDSYVSASILGRAIKNKKINIKAINPRDFSKEKHKKVDDRPYGGGPGMVMQIAPILSAVNKASANKKNAKIIIFSASGKQFSNDLARKWAQKHKDIIMVCGRYEGTDARLTKILKAEEISVGPYILTGGELPALVVMDSVSRQISGVLGKSESLEESRISTSEVYTRPEIFVYKKKKYKVPKVLLSGDQKKIEEWKKTR
ncbi:MAG: tRNA (guanosine(37)-N1)-methyltransferase TrmD [Candidatus Paceibacterota bacterium]|jgi:tRNA (guanine37-N1)-methyltransferase